MALTAWSGVRRSRLSLLSMGEKRCRGCRGLRALAKAEGPSAGSSRGAARGGSMARSSGSTTRILAGGSRRGLLRVTCRGPVTALLMRGRERHLPCPSATTWPSGWMMRKSAPSICSRVPAASASVSDRVDKAGPAHLERTLLGDLLEVENLAEEAQQTGNVPFTGADGSHRENLEIHHTASPIPMTDPQTSSRSLLNRGRTPRSSRSCASNHDPETAGFKAPTNLTPGLAHRGSTPDRCFGPHWSSNSIGSWLN